MPLILALGKLEKKRQKMLNFTGTQKAFTWIFKTFEGVKTLRH